MHKFKHAFLFNSIYTINNTSILNLNEILGSLKLKPIGTIRSKGFRLWLFLVFFNRIA